MLGCSHNQMTRTYTNKTANQNKATWGSQCTYCTETVNTADRTITGGHLNSSEVLKVGLKSVYLGQP